MRGAALWARLTAARHRMATVLLATMLGLAAAVVMAAVAAAHRSDSSVHRLLAANRSFDGLIFSCPPGIDPSALEGQAEVNAKCLNPTRGKLTADRLSTLPGVEAVGVGGAYVVGVLDPGAPSGWGRVTLAQAVSGDIFPDAAAKVLVGRLPDPKSDGEVVLTESALDGPVHVGDRLTLASWAAKDLDAGVTGGLPPETSTVVHVTVVGIARFPSDLTPSEQDASDNYFRGEIRASGRTATAMQDFANYGVGAAVRLRDGPATFEEVVAEAQRRWPDDLFLGQPATQTSDDASIERRIDLERHALITFALIAGLATAMIGGLTMARQLRREQSDLPVLRRLGMTRRDLAAAGGLRSLAVGVPAALVAVGGAVALSPLTPLGLARRADPDIGVYTNLPVLAVGALVVVAIALAIGLVTPVMGLRPAPPPRTSTPSALSPLARLGAVPSTARRFARGGWPRTASVVAAVALGAIVTGATAVASLERVTHDPMRYGSWWDADFGDYSEPTGYAEGVKLLAADPRVLDLAGLMEQTDAATIDGVPIALGAFVPEKGTASAVVVRGHAPTDAHEIALGARTLHRLHTDVGAKVHITSAEGVGSVQDLELTVTGQSLFNDPVTPSANLGDVAIVTPELFDEVAPTVPQRLVARFAPGSDPHAVIADLARSYRGGIRVVSGPDDVRNLAALRALPWLLALFIGLLAVVTLAHALIVTVLARRRDLTVLRVLGLEQRRARSVMSCTTGLIVGVAVAFGIPLGLVGGRLLWDGLAGGVGIPSDASIGWGVTLIVVAGAVIAAELVTRFTTWRSLRAPAAELLTST